MNRSQQLALVIATANLVLVGLFPPYDYLSLAHDNVPTFAGFLFAFGVHHNQVLNANFLSLEVIVILINATIAWLLLSGDEAAVAVKTKQGANRNQRILLGIIAFNLVLILLFPPFENYTAITKAALPTFEGFYFVFGNNAHRQIVTTILYIELALVLINGGLLWLLFKDRRQENLSAEEIRAMAGKVKAMQKR